MTNNKQNSYHSVIKLFITFRDIANFLIETFDELDYLSSMKALQGNDYVPKIQKIAPIVFVEPRLQKIAK